MSHRSAQGLAIMKAAHWGILCLMLLAAPALAGNRYALIVGNAAYTTLPPLQNTIADAQAYAGVFGELGYDVTSLSDLNRRDMEFALVDFLDQIRQGDTAVFVYSGHGWSDGKTNFLLPTDVTMEGSERRMRLMSIPLQNGLDGIVDQIRQAGASVQVAIIDACRNNIFSKDGTKSVGMTRGLSVERAPQGAFLIFSAGSGEESLDRLSTDDASQKLSVFTRHFLPRLRAGMYLEDAINAAQLETAEAALSYNNHQQNPAYYDQINGKLCLSGSCSNQGLPKPLPVAAAAPTVAVTIAPTPAPCSEARAVWDDVKDIQDVDILAQFAETYQDCKIYAGLAQAKVAELSRAKQSQPATPPVVQWAAGQTCDALWHRRNQIFHERGYCFAGARGIATFGNGSCYTKQPELSSAEEGEVARIKQMERNKGC